MGRRSILLAAAALSGLASVAVAGEDAPKAAPAAPREDALKELGRRLFFDPAASRVGMRACSDCHHPSHGYGDPETLSRDDVGPTRRHAQTIIDSAGLRAGHWDGEFERIEDVVRSRLAVEISPGGQARYPTQSAREESDARKAKDPGLLASEATDLVPDVGGGPAPGPLDRPAGSEAHPAADALLPGFVNPAKAASLPDAAARIAALGRYGEAFEAAFGSRDVTTDRLASALQRYCRGVVSGESAYDRFAAGKADALSDAAKRGLALFRGTAGCVACHTLDGPRATFTDGDFHDTGVSWRAHAADDRGGDGDLGHGRHTHRIRHFRAFKTPTLRDVAVRGPWMHDGSLHSLEAVVRGYAEGPPADPRIDPAFPKFSAVGTDVADLVAFLESLTSDGRPGLAPTAWSRRAEETRLAFVDADGKPIAGLRVLAVPAGDALPGFVLAAVEPRTTDADGAIRFAPPRATHVRVVFDGELAPWSGALVPDTCRDATIRVAVRGRAALRVRFAKDADPPATLVGTLVESTVFPFRRPPVALFARKDRADVDDGVEVTYETPFRTDVGPRADLVLPGPKRRVTLDPATPASVTVP